MEAQIIANVVQSAYVNLFYNQLQITCIIFLSQLLDMQEGQFEFYVPQQKYLWEKISTICFDQEKPKENPLPKCLVISGFPYDEGTRRNGGRVGGAVASTIFRKRLKQINNYLLEELPIFDSSDINNELDLQTAHIKLYEKHKRILQSGKQVVLFSIGGSNDQSYPNVRALLQTYPQQKIGVINLDAHFDVRPLKEGKAHSGSPFRQMLENQIFKKNKSKFVQFACKGATCSNQHYLYLKEKGADVYWLEKNIRLHELSNQSQYKTQAGQLFEKIIQEMKKEVGHIFVSFDTDCINSKYMPGVSAPSVVGGLTSTEAIQIMTIAGLEPKVRMVDFSEFNPAVESFLSSKMLVQMFHCLASSLAKRLNVSS